jgi:hypothetical protein
MRNSILLPAFGIVMGFLLSAPSTQAVNSKAVRDGLTSAYVAQTKALVDSLTEDQQAKIRAILDSNKAPYIVKSNQTPQTLAAETTEQRNQEFAQLAGMKKALNDWATHVNAEIRAVLNPAQAAAFDASRPPSPEEFAKPVRPQTGSNYCYNAYYYEYNYVYSVYAYYAQLYAFNQVLYDRDAIAYQAYALALSAYVYSYYGYLESYNAWTVDQSTYGYDAYYDTNYALYLSGAVYPLELNLGYYLDSSSNAYNAYLYGYYAWYYSYNYANFYAYYCYLGY